MSEEKYYADSADKETVRAQRLGRPRRNPSSAGVLTMMAALAMGGACAGARMPWTDRVTPAEPTKHDEERLRLAVERRKRRAEKKAENIRRTEAGKRPTKKLSEGGLDGLP
jgi:hypothetical protein